MWLASCVSFRFVVFVLFGGDDVRGTWSHFGVIMLKIWEKEQKRRSHSHALLVFHFRQSAVGDITIDDSVSVSFGSIRPHAQDELINDEDDDDDDDELLTSGIVEPAEAPVAVEQVNNLVQLSDDDDDDDELLTSDIISPVRSAAHIGCCGECRSICESALATRFR